MRFYASVFGIGLLIGGMVYLYFYARIPVVGIDQTPALPAALDPCAGEWKTPRFTNSLSCASTSCHGAVKPAAGELSILRNEFRTWFDEDPHANALRVLGNSVSQRMVQHLVGQEPQAKDYQRVYSRCFACHNTTVVDVPNALVTKVEDFEKTPLHEGVGCQACHGAASEWEDRHYFDCWQQLSDSAKHKRGFVNTEPFQTRAEMCARCHVGDGPKDVDHDLIAAGHPQMKFEMLGYQKLMPVHWNPARHKTKPPAAAKELWAAGQLATMKASLKLLEYRALHATGPRKSQDVRWPEFSEFDCFACHHDLQDRSWRSQRGFTTNNHKVVLPWSVWHFAMLPELADGSKTGHEFFLAYQTLKNTMETQFAPNPKLIQTQAKQAGLALQSWIDHAGQTQVAQELAAHLKKKAKNQELIKTWDQAVQLYLAAYAVNEAETLSVPNPLEPKLRALRQSLGFAEDYHSPKEFPAIPGTKTDVREQLRAVLEVLAKPKPD